MVNLGFHAYFPFATRVKTNRLVTYISLFWYLCSKTVVDCYASKDGSPLGRRRFLGGNKMFGSTECGSDTWVKSNMAAVSGRLDAVFVL